MIGAVLFWGSTAALGWVYAGYPIAAGIAGRIRPFRVRPSAPPPRRVTVGITVHNAEHEIADRVADILRQEVGFELEVLIASDGSTDGTDAIGARLAAEDQRVRLLRLPRGGATAAQNAIFAAASGEIVSLTDAETRYREGCLAALVAPFADPRVGAVTGRLLWAGPEGDVADQEGGYWRYEQVVRRLESRAGWLCIVTGALVAMRASVHRPMPTRTAPDGMLALQVRDAGLVVLVAADAVATDRGIAELHQQFRNRARIATHGIEAILTMAGRLTPWRRPSAFLAVWSHKLLRWATPWLATGAGTGALLLVVEGQPVYLVPVGAGGLVLVLAALGYVAGDRPAYPRWLLLPLAVVNVNAAFLVGWINVVRGRHVYEWHGVEYTAR